MALWAQAKHIRFLIISIFVGFIMSCSSLLYYPDNNLYIEEDFLEFKPQDITLQIEKSEVHAWYFSAKKPKGVIAFFHGNGQNVSSHIIDIYWLIKEGYDVLGIEYPGYGGTDGEPTPKNTVQTGHAALRYISKQKPDLPIIVYGQSLGGAVALRSVLDMQNEVPVALVVVNGTFLSYKKVGQKALAKSWLTWPIQFLPHAVLSDRYAPGDSIANLKAPLLVIHDKKDPVVPYELGEELFAKAPEPKELWAPKEGRHSQPFAGESGLSLRKRFLNKLDTALEQFAAQNLQKSEEKKSRSQSSVPN